MKTFFLFLGRNSVSIFDGVKTVKGHKGPYIQLPVITGVPANKFRVPLDLKNPAIVDKEGKIYELFFKIYGGQRFRDAGFVTACAPLKDNDAIAVITSNKRWTELGLEIVSGQPNGEFPGVQILKEGDTLKFTHLGITYQLTNRGSEPWLTKVPKPVVKKVKAKKLIEEKLDNRQKVAGLKVVKIVELPENREKKTEVKKNPQIERFEKKSRLNFKKQATFKIGELLKGARVSFSAF